MVENNKHHEVSVGSNRSFGLVFFCVFVLIAFFPTINNDPVRIWAIIISLILGFLGLINSSLLTVPNKLWFKFGMFLGKIVSPLIMALIYILVVTSTGLILRMFGKHLLDTKFNKNIDSYWILRNQKSDSITGTMKDQF